MWCWLVETLRSPAKQFGFSYSSTSHHPGGSFFDFNNPRPPVIREIPCICEGICCYNLPTNGKDFRSMEIEIRRETLMNPSDLTGRVAVVVGAGQTKGTTLGNGRATAIVFARAGAKVIAVDRDFESAKETAEMIGAEGGQAHAIQADVTDEQSLIDMVAETMRIHGRIDILHNNVGVAGAGGDQPIEDITAETFDRLSDVNIKG